MKATGKTTKCMVKEFTTGQTVENMRETMLTIKSKVTENIPIPMVVATRVSGATQSSTEKESS